MSRNSTINHSDLGELLKIACEISKIEGYNNIFMADKLQEMGPSPSKKNSNLQIQNPTPSKERR